MITEDKMIRPLLPHEWAVAVAKLTYEKWQTKNQVPAERRVKFEDDLIDYLCNGFVVSRPTIFWMAKIIEVKPRWATEPELAWFVRIAVGPMEELFQTLPAFLPNIAFCRRGDGRVRVFPLEKFVRKVYRKHQTSNIEHQTSETE
jgi:hypothetical protein